MKRVIALLLIISCIFTDTVFAEAKEKISLEEKEKICLELEKNERVSYIEAKDMSGTGYYLVENRKVSANAGLCCVGFYADWEHRQNASDRINRAYNPFCNVALGSYSGLEVEINRPEETLTRPAEAVCRADVVWGGGIVASGTQICRLNVGNDTYTVSNK